PYLQGFCDPIRLPIENSGCSGVGPWSEHATESLPLSAESTDALRLLAERNRITLNTLVQGAWALLLSRYSGQRDVVFGATRACRRSSVPDAESIVGPLLNTVPVRVDVAPEAVL